MDVLVFGVGDFGQERGQRGVDEVSPLGLVRLVLFEFLFQVVEFCVVTQLRRGVDWENKVRKLDCLSSNFQVHLYEEFVDELTFWAHAGLCCVEIQGFSGQVDNQAVKLECDVETDGVNQT